MDMKSRLKNYGLWISVASFVALLLQNYGVQFDLGKYHEIVNAGLGILVLLGIINNPTSGNGFMDK